jgi:hypothetical protein
MVCHTQQPDPSFKVKVTLGDLRSTLSIWGYISCLVQNFLIHKGFKNSTNIHNDKTICHAQKPVANLQGQDHSWRSKINKVYYRVYILCPVNTFFIYKGISKLFWTNVYNHKTMCHAQTPVTYLKDQGLRCTSKINIVCFRVYFVSSA